MAENELYEKFNDLPITKETLREMVKAAVIKGGADLTKEQKIDQAKVLIKMFEEGKDPRESMHISDKDLGNMYSYAFALFNAGKYDEAKCMFLYLLSIVPFNPTFSMGLAVCYHRLKKFEDAAYYYFQSAFVDKDNPVPFFYAYDCYNELNDPSSCIQALANVILRARKDKKYSKIQEKAQLLLDGLLENHPDLYTKIDKDQAK